MTRAVDVSGRGVRVEGRGVGVGSAIPDSSVDYGTDGGSTTNVGSHGMYFSTSQDWIDFQGRISSLSETAPDEEMVIGDTNGNDVAVVDVSGLTSNDVATFNGVNLSKNTEYTIYLRTPNANSRQRGFDQDGVTATFPVTSSDGNLEFTNGYFNGSRYNTYYGVREIGNINL